MCTINGVTFRAPPCMYYQNTYKGYTVKNFKIV